MNKIKDIKKLSNIKIGTMIELPRACLVADTIAEHADWMRKTHSLEAGGGIHLVDYYVARADEQNNIADPSQGTTGNILYSINETYVLPEGIDQHMEQGMKWEGFEQFVGTLQKYGKVLIGGGTVIQAMQ